MKVKLAILMLCMCASLFGNNWLERKAEGWAWYEDKESKETVNIQPSKEQTASEKLALAKKSLEDKLAEALITPTEENIHSYIVEQHRWLEQSSRFSDIWARTILKHPELDPAATYYPVSQYGIQLRKEINYDKRLTLISDLSKENGLFFFYEGHSKISQAFAKVVKEFVKKHHWQVIAISVDGVVSDNFTNSKIDNGIAKSLQIKTFPCLFIINPSTKEATPISYGLSSLDRLEQNITMQFNHELESLGNNQ